MFIAKRKVLAIKKEVPATWEEGLQEFLFWKQDQGLAERTLADYQSHVNQFFRRYPEAYRSQKLKVYVLEYMAQSVKSGTFNLRLINLKVFLAGAYRKPYSRRTPWLALNGRKQRARLSTLRKPCWPGCCLYRIRRPMRGKV